MIYGDLAPNDGKSLTYTTPPLDDDLTVTGHPLVNLWMTSSTNDGQYHRAAWRKWTRTAQRAM